MDVQDDTTQVELLKELLLQQTRRSEHLGQQAAAKDWERWELLQLLRQKDEQLEYEASAASRQRAVLSSARSSTRHYRTVCCLRAWRDHVHQLCAERALLRAKNKLAVGRIRHAGSLLKVVLKHAVERQLGSALHSLWLNTASQDIGGADRQQASAEDTQEPQDDWVFSTPRRRSSPTKLRSSPLWDPSPQLPGQRQKCSREGSSSLLAGSMLSEVSTAAPPSALLERSGGVNSSSSSASVTAESCSYGMSTMPATPQGAVAAARLAVALEGVLTRRRFWALSRLQRLGAQKAMEDAKLSDESERELHSLERQGFERRCAELEQRANEEAQWREEAERRIKEMAACGESLERERLLLRRELAEVQRHEQVRREQAEALHESLEQEEQLGELLRARLWALEQDSEEMAGAVEAEKAMHMEGAVQLQEQLVAFGSERADLVAALQDAEASQEAAVQQAAEKVRRSLLEAWGRDRGQWAEERAELGAIAAAAEEEARMARYRAADAEADSAAKVRWATAEAREVARAELRGEEQICSRLAAELRERIGQAEILEKGLASHMAETPEADGGISLPGTGFHGSQPSTPQLQQLDAYAEIVDELRSEVLQERAEREASASNLAALRGSYRLLLQRASTEFQRSGSEDAQAASAGEPCKAMPMAWAVH
eukprot:TRINITY_DN29412_c0_g1_i1.p1 TRINITY_DN29412_c0_g1~~TRINITY_DN29412_c0_g1_i1.p1  ORF type:complete len:661 (-),score=196.65 TRINITY_DN29412_c0_g1_i1:83-2065(-)